jgi:hypothetical protein
MPTYQSTANLPWVYPEQAIAKNKKGVAYVRQDIPSQEFQTGAANPFDAHTNKVALDRVSNNHRKMLGQIGVADTTESSQRYKNNASQSQSHINGKFKDPAYEFSATAGGLRGGTQYFFYSEDGQNWLTNWRKRRIQELNNIQTGDYTKKPERVEVAPDYNVLDAAFAKVLDEFESGAFPSSMIDDFNKVQLALLQMGSKITAPKLAQYAQILGQLEKQVSRINARGEEVSNMLDSNGKRVLKASGLVIDRLQRLILEINKHINEPQDVRQRAVEEIGSRILGAVARIQAPVGSKTKAPAGTQRNMTTGELAQRLARTPKELGQPELELPAGTEPSRATF